MPPEGLDELDDERPRRDPETPLGRILGRDARRYAEAWGIDLDDPSVGPDGDSRPLSHRLFDVETKFMLLAHSEAEDGLPWGERIDLETFALGWRPATIAETLRALAEDERRRRRKGFRVV
jgi:hypothetical protein